MEFGSSQLFFNRARFPVITGETVKNVGFPAIVTVVEIELRPVAKLDADGIVPRTAVNVIGSEKGVRNEWLSIADHFEFKLS
jgi:hypothetical protein